MGVPCNFGQNFGKSRINHHYTMKPRQVKRANTWRTNTLNISAKVSHPHGSYLLTIHYIHIPCDIDCVHSHVGGMESDISGFVARVFLNEEPQKWQMDAFSTIYTPKGNDNCASFSHIIVWCHLHLTHTKNIYGLVQNVMVLVTFWP